MNGTFLNDLRYALNHLYDPELLRRSPLCALLGITGPYEQVIKLQRILEDAIHALQPSTTQATSFRRRRLHDLLTYRYVQQFSQKQVADELGISVSQLAREQQAALQALAMHLWEKYKLADRWQAVDTSAPPDALSVPTQISLSDDLAWAAVPSPEKQADPKQILAEAFAVAEPLFVRYHAQVDIAASDTVPMVAAYPVVLRQILLNLLSALLPSLEGGHVAADCQVKKGQVCVVLVGEGVVQASTARQQQTELEVRAARQLVELSGGNLAIEYTGKGERVTLYLPAIESVPVLVIDDNPDHLSLLQRYLVNSRYRLLTASDPERGLVIAAQTKLAAIVVDIMMPRIDGWAILEQLHITPATESCPVIVCSILPLQELALSLGAHAFLAKPISQQDLLMTLDRLTAQQETGWR